LNRLLERVLSKSSRGTYMTSKKQTIADAKRDRQIAEAVNHALYAMRLVDGMVIERGLGTLHFDREMAKLEKALELLSERDIDAARRFAHRAS
jgi:hypothetical protein